MVRKEDVDFYCSFSRKELQSLCKKYNLPANRSSSDMAESLASYFERNSLSGTGNAKKGYDDSKLENIREVHSQTARARDTGFTLVDKTYYQEMHGGSVESACARQFIRSLNEKGPTGDSGKDLHRGMDCWLENRTTELNTDERPQETHSPRCRTYSTFEFHVSSEEGINLSVDLNFNPSDWINSMTNEVRICNSIRSKKSRLSDEGTDYHTESKKQKSESPLNVNPGLGKDGPAVEESSISLPLKGNSQIPPDHQPSGGGSLTSTVIEPCSTKRDASDRYKEDQRHNLYIPDPDASAPGQIVSCAELCSNSCCMVSLELDCVMSPGKKTASDSVTVTAECPSTLDTRDNLMGELPNEISENPSQESPRKVGNSSTVTPICPGGGGSETSSSETTPYRLKASCSPLQCRQELFGIKCGGAGKERNH
ncbi:PREDICTED: uncharacterized protein LOC104800392 isoform X2 [Tarenaya hassleriana]|uniref:uncharacterized protein LOC104800392 isoform X2 n=1 Tax=Tarenaya hassleriana TaxID=28532 RepID=UPI00053C4508|nr:PREDICTED: uncharacterized protein LOC104800392 isoform X2 [Tarenaya hassleriana]